MQISEMEGKGKATQRISHSLYSGALLRDETQVLPHVWRPSTLGHVNLR